MDISGRSIEAVLYQKGDNERKQIIACASKTFNKYEKKYPITEQECLMIVQSIEKFKQYLDIKLFKIVTDHMIFKTI